MSGIHDLAAALLVRLEPERAHAITIAALKAGLGPRIGGGADSVLATSLAGLALTSPIGMAAGFDKNAEVPQALLAAGFGFVECGTVTPRPQPGNPRPRLFRLTEDRAVINRLGFNNGGLEAFAGRLAGRRGGGVVGANVGANKDSIDRIGDYVAGLRRLWGLADYFTLNVSSPNTPGLRALQSGSALTELLDAVRATRADLAPKGRAPVFLKVAPDVEEPEAAPIVEAAVRFGLDGLIVSNTTIARPPSLRSMAREETGGLSGAPLMDLSTRRLRTFHEASAGRLTLIGVGGVASGADALAKIRAGASAVQLYTGMVYAGAGLAAAIARDLAARLRAEGFDSIAQAIGAR